MMVSLGNKKGGGPSSTAGLAFIGTSLALDGLTGGLQNRLKSESKKRGLKPKPYDFMFWTNLFMAVTALVVSLANGEFFSGLDFMAKNPAITSSISKFAVCSAIGQSFIFYTISNFDSLVCTTVTTTRKIFSVLLSIFLNGHAMSTQGWAGISVASLGILAEI
jgi:UDP-galactose transporter B1